MFSTVAPAPVRVVESAPISTRAIDSFTEYPGLTEQLLAAQGLTGADYRVPSIREALGVPTIWRAVSLLSNTGAALPVQAYRNGELMDPTPALVRRPNPFTTRRAFVRQTIYYLATRGEAFWYVAARDTDGSPLSLIPVTPAEVRVRWASGLEGVAVDFTWRNRPVRREDMIHLTFMRDGSSPRGMGPLQLCGAAIAVGLESLEWAAQYFSSDGIANVVLKTAADMTEPEADALKDAWTRSAGNTPKVASGGVEPESMAVDPDEAAYVGVRGASAIDAATMFGIPAHLVHAAVSGSSLTYQNLGEVATEFVRFTLWPGYLEPIEQAWSDLLARSTTVRFAVDELSRPDIETRYRVHESAIRSGVYDAEHAQRVERILPGSPLTAPNPPAPPAAFPASIPERA